MSREAEVKSKFPSSPPPSSPPPSGTNHLSGAFSQETRPRQPTIHPSDLETLTENYAKRPPDGFSPDKAIFGKIADLEEWAQTISAQERRETFRFWIMKGLSFFAAVASAAGGALFMPRLAVGAGIVTAISIAVDAAWPHSGDRNARRRAVHDLRELQHTLKLKWEKVRLAYPDPLAVKRIAHALALLDSTQAKREEIGGYLGEASPAVSET
jgi:hypothetical protein